MNNNKDIKDHMYMRELHNLASIAFVAALYFGTPVCSASSQQLETADNWHDGNGTAVWKNGSNELCWRDAEWTPATANPQCDGALTAMRAEPAQSTREPPLMVTCARYWPPNADVLFDLDSITIKPSGKRALDRLVSQLPNWKLEMVVVTGYTDHLGASAHNDALSLRRALGVRAYLVRKGIPETRIYAEGKGARNRITGACNEHIREKAVACLEPDRRVEVEVLAFPKE